MLADAMVMGARGTWHFRNCNFLKLLGEEERREGNTLGILLSLLRPPSLPVLRCFKESFSTPSLASLKWKPPYDLSPFRVGFQTMCLTRRLNLSSQQFHRNRGH